MSDPKTYKDSEIIISMQCQGPWRWTCAVEGEDFGNEGLQTYTQHKTPADALRELATAFEMRAQKQMFYHRIGVSVPEEQKP